MRSRFWAVFPFLLAGWAGLSGVVHAEDGKEPEKGLLTLELPVAIPVGKPLSQRFGLGTMPSAFAGFAVGEHLVFGARLRVGFLSKGDPPEAPGLKEKGAGGLALLSAAVRFLPLPSAGSPGLGPFLDMGVGPGLTGKLIRPMVEVGVGYGFSLLGLAVSPTVRYLHVVQYGNELDNSNATVLLAGVEASFAKQAKKPVPIEPETKVEVEKAPEVEIDTDGDGIPDSRDACPKAPEDKDGFEDDDGCPDPDNDKDRIPDVRDKCPNDPETVNGIEDDDGCPDKGIIEVKEERLSYEERVLFDTNRARVLPEGRPILEAIVHMWKQHPEWDRLVIEGHTDKRGPDEYNNWLSQERAERTRKYLIELGFPEDKVEVAGYGRRLPRVDGDDERAYRQNRRVEFVIVRKTQDEVPATDAAPGPAPDAASPPAPVEPGTLEPPSVGR